MSIILVLASTLAFLGVLLFLLAWRARSKTGIPLGSDLLSGSDGPAVSRRGLALDTMGYFGQA